MTAGLGLVLGYLCWQSRSLFPAILAHFLHNAIGTLQIVRPTWFEPIGLTNGADGGAIPASVTVVGLGVFLTGLILTAVPMRQADDAPDGLAAERFPQRSPATAHPPSREPATSNPRTR